MKELSRENWLELDDRVEKLERLGADPFDPAELAADFLQIRVSPLVPAAIRADFERARAALVYGSLYYPLYSLGVTEMARVALRAFDFRSGGRATPTDEFGDAERTFWAQVPAIAEGDFVGDHSLGPDEIHDVAKRLAHAISALFDPSVEFLAAWSRSR